MTAFIEVGGHRALRARVHVPQVGPWHADVDLETAPEVSGRVTLRLGDLGLEGTIMEGYSGTLAAQRRVRILAGAGGWTSTRLAPKAYHNDAGIRARTVAEDAARDAGETLGTFTPAEDRIGIDYVRPARLAARVLEDAIGSAAWWVDYAGDTQVGSRAETAAASGTYEVLDYDPRARVVTIAASDLGAVGIGSVLSERLDEAQTVRELEIVVSEDEARIKASCGTTSSAWLVDAIRAIVRAEIEARLSGLYQYRVVRMASDRVELQAVSRAAGLPDVLPISQWPGLAGAHADLTPGAEVLVAFVGGDRTRPVVVHYIGRGGSGWAPASLALDATASIQLGSGAEQFVALSGDVKARLDAIQSAFDAHVHLAGAITAPAGGGTCTGSSAAPTPPLIGALAGVAATKVTAE